MKTFRLEAVEVLKVALAAWGTLWLEPWVDGWFKAPPKFLTFAIAGLISATLLHVGFLLLFGNPRTQVVWKRVHDATPCTSIELRLPTPASQSELYQIEVSRPEFGWVGSFFARRWIKKGLVLRISAGQAPVYATIDNCSESPDGSALVTENDRAGVDFLMSDLPTDLWRFAVFSYERRPGQSNTTPTVTYSWLIAGEESWFAQWVLKARSDVSTMRVVLGA